MRLLKTADNIDICDSNQWAWFDRRMISDGKMVKMVTLRNVDRQGLQRIDLEQILLVGFDRIVDWRASELLRGYAASVGWSSTCNDTHQGTK